MTVTESRARRSADGDVSAIARMVTVVALSFMNIGSLRSATRAHEIGPVSSTFRRAHMQLGVCP